MIDLFNGRIWNPQSTSGLIGSAVVFSSFAAVYWWYGIIGNGLTIGTLSMEQYVSGFLLGAFLTGGYLLLLLRPALRARCEAQIERAAVTLAVGFVLALLVVFAQVVLALGMVVLAFGAILGRTVLYVIL